MNADDMNTQPGITSTPVDVLAAIFAETWMGYRRHDAPDTIPHRAAQVKVYTSPRSSFSFAVDNPLVARRLAMQLLHAAEDLERVAASRRERLAAIAARALREQTP